MNTTNIVSSSAVQYLGNMFRHSMFVSPTQADPGILEATLTYSMLIQYP